MTPYIVIKYHDHDPRIDCILYGDPTATKTKRLDSPHGVADVLAWCTGHDCHASEGYANRCFSDVARVYTITPKDDDSAFEFRMRWL